MTCLLRLSLKQRPRLVRTVAARPPLGALQSSGLAAAGNVAVRWPALSGQTQFSHPHALHQRQVVENRRGREGVVSDRSRGASATAINFTGDSKCLSRISDLVL